LLARPRGTPPGARRIDARLEDLIAEVIRDVYLTRVRAIVLKDSELRDAPDYRPQAALWNQAARSCGYIQSRQAVSQEFMSSVASRTTGRGQPSCRCRSSPLMSASSARA
jgi:hypothetical protein